MFQAAAVPLTRAGALTCALALATCAPSSRAAGPASPSSVPSSSSSPSPGAPARRFVHLSPSGSAAAFYRSAASAVDERALAPDPLRDAIRAAVRELARGAGATPPEADARLDLAMNDFARALGPEDLPAAEAVDFVLAYHGLVDPPPHWLLERASAGSEREIAERTAPPVLDALKGMPAARLGVGIDRSAGELRIVVAVQEKDVDLEPIPREIRLGLAVPIAGRLQPGFHDPALVVTAPDGSVRELAARSVGARGRFEGSVSCGAGAGRYQVELAAAGAGGPAVLANFPLYCGVQPPREAPGAAGVLPAPTTARQAEDRLLALVNRDRAAAGLPALTVDARLAEAARAHSHDMSDHDFVAHISPSTGSAVERVARVGLAPALLLENVGRAYSADDAESGFMASPGHRGNILDRRARFIGIGVAVGREAAGSVPLLVTQLMM